MTTPIGRGMTTVVAAVRSALFMVVFYLGSVPLIAVAAVAGLISTPAVIAASHTWAGWFAWTARVILGIRYRIVGTVPDHAALVALKHQSAYETIMILWLFRRPATVLKAELLGIPLWGGRRARTASSRSTAPARRRRCGRCSRPATRRKRPAARS